MPALLENPNVIKPHRVRIQNTKSGRYLSVEGDENNWKNNEATLSIKSWINMETNSSPQVWIILPYMGDTFVLINQYTGYLAGTLRRDLSDNAAICQHYSQLTFASEPFQRWQFSALSGGIWTIKNVHSKKFIGPKRRSEDENCVVIQWGDQTAEDNYQNWKFEDMDP